jgi:hypothetical protein
LDSVICFLFEGLLKERAGESAQVISKSTGTGLRIEVRGSKIERGCLEEWFKGFFRHFETRPFPFGFLVQGQKERFVVTVSANKEFNSKDILPSFVTIEQFSS